MSTNKVFSSLSPRMVVKALRGILGRGGQKSLTSELTEEAYIELSKSADYSLGLSEDGKHNITISATQMTKHLTVFSEVGCGGYTLCQNLAIQHMAKGGGVFYIDVHPQSQTLEQFKRILEKTGRLQDLVVLSLDSPLDAKSALLENKVVYLASGILDARGFTQRDAVHQTGKKLAQLVGGISEFAGERKENAPPYNFMIVLLNVGLLYDETPLHQAIWTSLFSHGRAYGVRVVTLENSLYKLKDHCGEGYPVILGNSYSTVYFKPHSVRDKVLSDNIVSFVSKTKQNRNTPNYGEALAALKVGHARLVSPEVHFEEFEVHRVAPSKKNLKRHKKFAPEGANLNKA